MTLGLGVLALAAFIEGLHALRLLVAGWFAVDAVRHTIGVVRRPEGLARSRAALAAGGLAGATLRSLRRDAAVLDRAAAGQEIVVTRRGKPYVRISPATEARSFLGAGRHLAQRRAVSPDPVPAREWKGMV